MPTSSFTAPSVLTTAPLPDGGWRSRGRSMDASLALHAVLRPVGHDDLAAAAMHRIRQVIELGIVTEGERLPPERELARRLGVARMTLRDALRGLAEIGYVTSRRGRGGGTFVTYRSDTQAFGTPHHGGLASDVGDALAMQAVLEPGAAEVAAQEPIDPSTRMHLRHLLQVLAAATSSAAFCFADARLHVAVAELTRSSTVVAAVADVQTALAGPLAALPPPAHAIRARHQRALVDAIIAGRPNVARQEMGRDVEATAARLAGAGLTTERHATPTHYVRRHKDDA